MIYHFYEFQHAALGPVRTASGLMQELFSHPLVPASYTTFGRKVVAACEVLERVTRRYSKPSFGIESVRVNGKDVPIIEEEVLSHRFCNLLHFRRDFAKPAEVGVQPKVLVVAPLSGHYATLLRGTVEALLQDHDVYITDWINAHMVPAVAGTFDLDDYIDYVRDFLGMLGPDVHVLAVCQPSVPVLAAVSLLAAEGLYELKPRTMTLMGGPIDTRRNPTQVNNLAETRPIEWFENNVIARVPPYYPGFMRKVYPGFVQLSGFMTMNLDKHIGAHVDLFNHMVEGDGDSADAHRAFYDEYNAVMDLPAEYYLQTIKTVFQEHSLPRGTMYWRKRRVDPSAIRTTALLTVEGEKDDISGVGQTQAAHDLCVNIPANMRKHILHPGVGHYGIFNGRRWREEIYPQVRDFIRKHA